jgi:hypothetical protein
VEVGHSGRIQYLNRGFESGMRVRFKVNLACCYKNQKGKAGQLGIGNFCDYPINKEVTMEEHDQDGYAVRSLKAYKKLCRKHFHKNKHCLLKMHKKFEENSK